MRRMIHSPAAAASVQLLRQVAVSLVQSHVRHVRISSSRYVNGACLTSLATPQAPAQRATTPQPVRGSHTCNSAHFTHPCGMPHVRRTLARGAGTSRCAVRCMSTGKASIDLGGKPLTLEVGRLGPLTDGLVFARWGDTTLLVSAVCGWELASSDFLPLQVDYREKAFAGGVIPSTFSRREASSSDRETLAARVIDRSLRPLFPRGFFYDTQLICSVLSFDKDADPAPLSIVAASAALLTSNIPWNGPAAAVRVGFHAGAPVILSSYEQEAASSLSLLYAGTSQRVLMMEGAAAELPERDVVRAMRAAAEALHPLLDMQRTLATSHGKVKKPLPLATPSAELMAAVRELIWDDARAMYSSHGFKKAERGNAQRLLFIKIREKLRERFPQDQHRFFSAAGDSVMKSALRSLVMEAAAKAGGDGVLPAVQHVNPTAHADVATETASLHHLAKGDAALVERRVAATEVAGVDTPAAGTSTSSSSDSEADGTPLATYTPTYTLVNADGCRPDGRSTTSIRTLRAEVDVLPLVHGSAIFTRGDTQVLCTSTLGPLDLAQTLRPASLGGQVLKKNFFLHYDFPPYCTNEVGKVSGLNRRMVGHGALAERALVAVMPGEDAFPYTVRVTSEVSGSDGSSSMATVCGATLALLDAGVPLKAPVAGISIGAFCPPPDDMTPGSRYALLTDIFGLEDHSGDMDFKIAGSRAGVTALQVDIKPAGLPLEVLEQALWRARTARMRVLDTMAGVMPRHREEMKASTPRVEQLVIPTEMLGKLVGPGGANVKRIQSATGARVQLDADNPLVNVYASRDSMAAAKSMITSSLDEHRRISGNPLSIVSSPLAPVLSVGARVTGRVSKIHEFGVVLSTLDGVHELGWMHISEFTPKRTGRVQDVLNEGDEAAVMVVDVDARGRGKLSMRALMMSEGSEDGSAYITRKSGIPAVSPPPAAPEPPATTTVASTSAPVSRPQSEIHREKIDAAPAPAPSRAPAREQAVPPRSVTPVSAPPFTPTPAATTAAPRVAAGSPTPAAKSSAPAPAVVVPALVDDPADLLGMQQFTPDMFAYLRSGAAAARSAHEAQLLPLLVATAATAKPANPSTHAVGTRIGSMTRVPFRRHDGEHQQHRRPHSGAAGAQSHDGSMSRGSQGEWRRHGHGGGGSSREKTAASASRR